jgi:hypothetical protein
MAPYRIHRLIQDLMKDPAKLARFKEDPDSVFDAYEITEAERLKPRDGSKAALIELGVHPNLQMKYFRMMSRPAPRERGVLEYYFEKLARERRHG